MKKHIVFILISFFCGLYVSAQEKIVVYNAGNILQESEIGNVDSIKFLNKTSIFHLTTNAIEIPISQIDSIIFITKEEPPAGDIVYITYNNSTASVVNPYSQKGVSISVSGNHVEVTSTTEISNIEYSLSGNSSDGSFSIASDEAIVLTLSDLSLINPSGAAINVTSKITATVRPTGTNTLADAVESAKNATILSKGALVFSGTGILNLKGYKKHAISSDKTISVKYGSINILQSANDGFHSEGFVMDGGSLDIAQTESDGIDAGAEMVVINGGTIKITAAAQDVKGIKGDRGLTINNGVITMIVSGSQSKGFGSKGSIVFNGGNISIVTSGATVLVESGSGYDPSYCTAIKADGDITINNGTITIESKSTSDGGKGLSADGNIVINNGTINITTAGPGKTYTNENGLKDSYTACCIKTDLDISLLGGKITCCSSGTGGKGISSDGQMFIGVLGNANENLILNVTTSGERFLVSGSGQNADYANPKAVKSLGNMTVNSGTIMISCTQNQEGGEGLETKATMTINEGVLNISTYDDCINASTHIAINGGTSYFVARNNDGVDSNGTLTIAGGFTISCGARAPEEGFDCDNNRFAITGGIAIGTGGNTSNPTVSACTQPTVKYTSATPGSAICIKNSSGKVILMYQLPTYSGGPGGGNQMTLLFTDPQFANGSYTLQYGGTISGGTNVNGYYTDGTYSGGSTKNFTISSMLTTVN